jgi:hypothetical protein
MALGPRLSKQWEASLLNRCDLLLTIYSQGALWNPAEMGIPTLARSFACLCFCLPLPQSTQLLPLRPPLLTWMVFSLSHKQKLESKV